VVFFVAKTLNGSSKITFQELLMRRFAFLASCLLATWVFTGCAALQPQPKTLMVSEAKLQQLISGQFPFNSKMLEVLDVGVSSPKIRLDAANNRIHTSLDVNVAGSGIVGLLAQREYKGALDLSYGLRFEPSDNSVRMTDVKLGKLQMNGAPDLMERPLSRLGVALAQKLLSEQVLYKVSAQDLEAAKGWGYKPSAFKIAPGGLAISLDPIEKK
jgi:hypothetical protein